MRLTELEPRWFSTYGTARHGMGVTLLCPGWHGFITNGEVT